MKKEKQVDKEYSEMRRGSDRREKEKKRKGNVIKLVGF